MRRLVHVLSAAALAVAWCVPDTVEAAGLNPGDLVIGNNGSLTTVSVVNPQTRVRTIVCNCTTLNTILDVAVRGTDRIYAIGQLAGSVRYAVVAIDPGTGAQSVVAQVGGVNDVSGIALEANGNILVSLSTAIVRVNATTGQQTTVTSGGRMVGAGGLTVGANGQIYLATSITGFPRGVLPNNVSIASGILRVDPVTGQQTVLTYGDDWTLGINSVKIIDAEDVTVDQAGNLYVLDNRYRGATLEDETRIIKVNPATGVQTLLNNSLKGVDRRQTDFDFRGIAYLNGEVYAVDYRLSETGLPGISKVSASGGTRTGVNSVGFFHPSGLAAVTEASPTPPTTPTPPTGAGPDCFFNWVERNYPQFFAPAGAPSATYLQYYYRYYPGTRNYLATANSRVFVLGPSFGPSPVDVGSLSVFLATAGCSP